jgi:C_GCAxxG_C_C family probable redox protein
MSKAEEAVTIFNGGCNCAQSVFTAYSGDFGVDKNLALSMAVGFGGGMGRVQDVCGVVSGAVMILGLKSGFKEGDGRDKINKAYKTVHDFIDRFTAAKGTIKCRELLGGCDLSSEEGQKRFKEADLKGSCRDFVRLSCDLLDELLAGDIH